VIEEAEEQSEEKLESDQAGVEYAREAEAEE
jgi:hypothetical protein